MSICIYSKFDPTTLAPLNDHTRQRLDETKLQDFDFAGNSVLDIGCHLGLLSFTAAKNGASQVLGVDVTPQFILEAQENLKQFAEHNASGERVTFEVAGFHDLEPAKHRSDIVFCFEVLHWLTFQGTPIPESIKKLRQLTKTDLIIEFPWDVTESSIAGKEKPLSVDEYSPELIFRQLTKHFEFVRVLGFMEYMASSQAKRVLVHAR